MNLSLLLVAALLVLTSACQKKKDDAPITEAVVAADNQGKKEGRKKDDAKKEDPKKDEKPKDELKKVEDKSCNTPVSSPAVSGQTSGEQVANPPVASENAPEEKIIKAPEIQKKATDTKNIKASDIEKIEEKKKALATKPQASEAKHEGTEGVDFVYLTLLDMRNLGAVLQLNFGPEAGNILEPMTRIQMGLVKNANFNGDLKAPSFTLTFQDGSKKEISNFEIKINKANSLAIDDFLFISICADSKCEILFSVLTKRQDKKFLYNMPMVHKLVNGKYIQARQKPDFELTEEELESLKSKEPPAQIKVQKQLEEQLEKNQALITKKLVEKVKADPTINYTYRLYSELERGFFDSDFIIEENSLQVKVNLKYRFKSRFKSLILNSKIEDDRQTILDKDTDSEITIEKLNGEKLILITIQQDHIASDIPGLNKGLYAFTCSALIENGVTFSECLPVSTKTVIGMNALEGRPDGPYIQQYIFMCTEVNEEMKITSAKPLIIKEVIRQNETIEEIPVEPVVSNCKK